MKKISLFLVLIAISMSVACNKKAEQSNKVRTGNNGRYPIQTTSPAQPGYCNVSNQQFLQDVNFIVSSVSSAPKADIQSSDINGVASYLFPNVEFGSILIAKIALRIVTQNPNNSVVVLRLYDDYGIANSDPLQLAMGNNLCGYPVNLRINGSQVAILFEDAIGTLEISGVISSGTFNASVFYSDKSPGAQLVRVGNIQLPVQGVIY